MVLRIGFGDFPKCDIAALKGVLQPLNGAISVGIDGVIHLYLQNQVGATLQIEAEVDPTLQRSQQTFAAQAAWNPEDAEQKSNQHRNNQKCFGEKILVHS